ncbi:hypothetical protein D3C72_1811660 [compost metagenome]
MRGMQPEQVLRDFRRHGALAQPALGFEHGDLGTFAACRGGDFEADPAAADHHDAAPGPQRRRQRQGIANRAQCMHGSRVDARDGERAGPAAGAQDQLVVRQHLSVGYLQALRGPVYAGDARVQPPLQPERSERFRLEQPRAGGCGLAGQHGLG